MTLIINFNVPLNLETHTSGDPSPLEDFITFFTKAPYTSASAISVQFQTAIGDPGTATFVLPVQTRRQPASTLGLASILEVQNDVEDLLGRDRFAGVSDQEALNLQIAEKPWIIPTEEWQYVLIPKRSFQLANGFSWASVGRMFYIVNQTFGTICISDLLLVGGGRDNGGVPTTADGTSDSASNGGLQGTYKYRIVYANSTTGNRSNPSVSTQVARDVNRGYVTLSNLPPSADPQVDQTEIYRTVGNGDRFFRIATIPDTQTGFEDQIADHDSIDSEQGIAIMSSVELQFDNDRPEDSFDGCIIHRLTAFWLSNDVGKTGRLYYSPIGRPESLEGFIDVTPAGDPLHRLLVHAGQRYAFSESTLYRIDGDNPYIPQKVAGVPGIQFAQRRTVVSTPFGIIWQAADGLRVTSGSGSQLLGFDAIGRLFRGEAVEGLPAFEGTVATFARGEYFISDGTRTLGIDLTNLAWRDVGFDDVSALFYEFDTDQILGGRAANTQRLEVEGVTTDVGSAVPIEWESPGVDFPNDQILFFDRVFIDIDPNSNAITPTVVHRFGTITLPPISDADRVAREFSVEQLVLKPGVRLTGNATSRVTLFDLAVDTTPLALGVNISGRSERNALAALRETFPGRYAEGVGNGEVIFEIPRQVKNLDMTDRVFVIDRLTIEANTNGTSITPTLGLVGGGITLAALNTAAREVVTYDLDRIGNPTELRLLGDWFTTGTRPTVYRVELHLREIELGVRFEQLDAPRVSFPAWAPNPDTEIEFEIPANRREFDDSGTLFVLDRLVIDANTGGAVFTPIIDVQAGGSIALPTFSTTSREYSGIGINRLGTIHGLRLVGDWSGDRRLFGAELYVRPLALGLNVTTRGSRAQVRGRMIFPTTEIRFEVQPLLQELNMEGSLFFIERIVVEANTNGSTITVLIESDGITITAGTVNTTSREYVELFVQRPAPIRSVRLQDDFTDDVQLFGVEVHVRPVEFGLQRLDASGRITYDGKMVDPETVMIFDIDPARDELDAVSDVPIIQFLSIEANTQGVNFQPVMETELGSIALSRFSTVDRETTVWEVQEVGKIQRLRLEGDWTAGAELYKVEALLGNLALGLRICEVN